MRLGLGRVVGFFEGISPTHVDDGKKEQARKATATAGSGSGILG